MPRVKGKPKPIVPNRDSVVSKIMAVQNKEHRALLAFIYLSACRICEIVGQRTKKWTAKMGLETRYKRPPILRSQLELRTHTNGEQYLLAFNVPILKRKDNATKNIPFNPKTEPELCNAIMEHANTKQPTEPLFDYHKDYVGQLVKHYLGVEYFTHFMRHTRITRLATDHNFNTNDLIAIVGWKDPRASSVYAHLSWEDTAKKI